MSSLVQLFKLKEFFEVNKVPDHNQEIMVDYLQSITREVRSKETVKNNVEFMKFLVTHTSKNLDELTKKDVNHIIDEINDLVRKRDGMPASDATKKQYRIGLTRFLRHYGEETDNEDLIGLANINSGKIRLTRKLPEDLLSRDDVNRMIAVASSIQEKALIATIYESGARRGEIEHCRIKDVQPNPNGFYIRLNGKTGARQVLFHLYQTYLRDWLNAHPMADDPNAPLFGKFKSQKDKKFKSNFIGLDGKAIYYIVKKTANKAGINRRCYPHIFRHSIATNMARTLSEQQLKIRFGWDPKSNMTAVYVHLSGRDVDDTLLESYGIIEKKREDGSRVNVCVRCGLQVSPGIRYCPNCGQQMTTTVAQDDESKLKEMLAILQKYPDMFAEVLAKAQK